MIDVSDMFPDYEKADAEIDGELVRVQLWSGGTFSTITMKLSAIYNVLTRLRR